MEGLMPFQTYHYLNRQKIFATKDPPTSKLAGDAITRSGKRDSDKAKVLAFLRSRKGLYTSAEIAALSGLDRYLCARRLPDLERDHFVRRGLPQTCTITKQKAITWEAV